MRGALNLPHPDRAEANAPLNSDAASDLAALDLFQLNKRDARITELRELLLFQLKNIDRAAKDLAALIITSTSLAGRLRGQAILA